MDLSSQIVLITGSSRGLGAAIARAFHSQGARIIINYYKNEEAATSIATELNALKVRADVRSKSDVERMFDEAAEYYGSPITTVVNNALVDFIFNGDGRKKIEELDWEDMNAQMEGSLKGAMLTTQCALSHFNRTGSGRIINIGTNLFQNPVVPYHDYTAAKGALLAFTRTCAAELGPRNITVNMVGGGLLRTTDASRATPEAVFDQIAALTPLRRVTTPEEMADAVLFFASRWGRGVTGQNLVVDGGLVMG